MPVPPRPRLLLTSTFRPWGVDDFYNTAEMNFDGLSANFTRHQEPFVPHGLNTLPATHFIAHNLKTPSVVLDHPTLEEFEREIARGAYDYIGISFMTCEFLKVRRMVEVARRAAPRAKIALGGYGVATPGVEDLGADAVCFGEGVDFFRKALGEDVSAPLGNPVIPAMPTSRFFGLLPADLVAGFYWYTTGLGCRMGCEFCVTSNFWGKRYRPLVKSGSQIFEEMTAIAESRLGRTLFAVNQDDFLMERERNLELWETARSSDRKPYGFLCFTSAKAASMYTPRQLIEMGLDVIFLGVETSRPRSRYGQVFNPRKHIPAGGGAPVDFRAVFRNLRAHGVKTVASVITCVPGHTPESQQADIERALDLEATLYQFSSYTPFPGTPLWKRLRKRGLIVYDCAARGFEPGWWKRYDGITLVYKHPHFTEDQAREVPRSAWEEENRRFGPSLLRMLECDMTAYEVFRDQADTPRMKRIVEDKAEVVQMSRPMLAAMQRTDLGLTDLARGKAGALLARIESRFGPMGRFERALAAEVGEMAARYRKKQTRGRVEPVQIGLRTAYGASPNGGGLASIVLHSARRKAIAAAPGFDSIARALDLVPSPLLAASLRGATLGLRVAAARRRRGRPL